LKSQRLTNQSKTKETKPQPIKEKEDEASPPIEEKKFRLPQSRNVNDGTQLKTFGSSPIKGSKHQEEDTHNQERKNHESVREKYKEN